jgi:hypothetical protein
MKRMGRLAKWLVAAGAAWVLFPACAADEGSGPPSTDVAAGAAGEAEGSGGRTGGTTGVGGSSGGVTGGTGGVPTGGSGGQATGGTGGELAGGSGGELTGGSGGSGGDLTGGGGGSGGNLTGGSGGSGGDSTGGAAGVATGGSSGTGGDLTGGTAGAGGSGGNAGSAGTGGQSGDPFEATVVPTSAGNQYSLSFGDTVFAVDASQAGRITTYSIGGQDVLDGSGDATGSVFWPSPQDLFPGRWPPPDEFDTAAYDAETEGNVIVMTSASDWSVDSAALGVTKRFWANAENEVVTIEYTIHNRGSSTISVAPWEVSRVYAGGLTFFPEPAAATRYSYPDTDGGIPFTHALDAAWFLYQDSDFPPGNYKSGADASEGWAAHVHCGSPNLEQPCSGSDVPVFVKQFENVLSSEFAPDQAEVEVYTNGDYVEFEVQGAYAAIPVGGELGWTVHWYLRSLPSSITPQTESADLLAFVRDELL